MNLGNQLQTEQGSLGARGARAGGWTFSRKLWVGASVQLLLLLVMAGVAVQSHRSLVESKAQLMKGPMRELINVGALQESVQARVVAVRGHLLTGQARFVDDLRAEKETFAALLKELNPADGDLRARVEAIRRLNTAHLDEVRELLRAFEAEGKQAKAVEKRFADKVDPAFRALGAALESYASRREALAKEASAQADRAAERLLQLLVGVALTILVLTSVVTTLLTRDVTRSIGESVAVLGQAVQELQTAAHEQATASNEQVASVQSTLATSQELLTSSRQISEASKQVAESARGAEAAGLEGQDVVLEGKRAGHEAAEQVAQVVRRILEMEEKSQQIGGMLQVIDELSEQTNILAVNATIEAAGAGEAGLRFAALASEIRGLAGRVGESTREIGTLVADVRGAVNSAVLATEVGSKAVERATLQLDAVEAAFSRLGGYVADTAEAAQEIELSTRQQVIGVEQVSQAMNEVSAAARETDSGSRQTLDTTRQLAQIARNLLELVQSE